MSRKDRKKHRQVYEEEIKETEKVLVGVPRQAIPEDRYKKHKDGEIIVDHRE
jgi:hypothetical protein